MYSFKNDYSEGCHPEILQALVASNEIQMAGYGLDDITLETIELLRNRMAHKEVDIHLLSGGTQTNLVALSHFMRPHEAVISATTGHIMANEAGSIEATGHKVIHIDTKNGKISAAQVEATLDKFTDEHHVKPKVVYISNSTEIGTIYTKQELTELYHMCQKYKLYLFVDGARLGSALTSSQNDLTLKDMAYLTDAFYIGGTKNGALLGEALVISNEVLKAEMRYNIKQKGALLAKGRVVATQFHTLFKDDLFFDLARHANAMADLLRDGFEQKGYTFFSPSSTNQVFPIVSLEVIERLEKEFDFYKWSKVDDTHFALRLVTSFATPKTAVEAFIKLL